MIMESHNLLSTGLVYSLYIDPNSGGLLMQFLVPVFVAIGAAWVFFKEKVSAKVTQLVRRFRHS